MPRLVILQPHDSFQVYPDSGGSLRDYVVQSSPDGIVFHDPATGDEVILGGSGLVRFPPSGTITSITFMKAGAPFSRLTGISVPWDGTLPSIDEFSGNFVVIGNEGNDTQSGLSGNDRLSGFGGDDFLSSFEGRDTVLGGAGNDALFGGLPDDTLGADFFDGGTGDDILHSSGGGSTLNGGDGNDTLFGSLDADTLNGGNGNDSLLAADAGAATGDRLSGGAGNDTVSGATGADSLDGGAGADRLAGGGGNDSLAGQVGNDSLAGQGGADTLSGGAGFDTLAGGAAADRFVFLRPNEGADLITDFGNGADKIVVSAAGFGGGLVAGAPLGAQFVLGNAPASDVGTFLYNAVLDRLFWDLNGTDPGGRTLIASFANDPTLAATDFIIL